MNPGKTDQKDEGGREGRKGEGEEKEEEAKNNWRSKRGGMGGEEEEEEKEKEEERRITRKIMTYTTMTRKHIFAGNSTQYSVMTYMGKESKKEWIHVYV